MAIYLLALAIGVVAGMRALLAPAAVSWAAHLGWLDLHDSWAGFIGNRWVAYVLGVMAVGELITDQLPKTPARVVPVQFAARIINGTFCGAVVGTAATAFMPIGGALMGALGAVLGTRGGYAFRQHFADLHGGIDRPGAFFEDAVAILGALTIMRAVGGLE
ncbi:MAG: DUF4126 family protein [Myxococcales bacterium]